jgi:hypothetical protein
MWVYTAQYTAQYTVQYHSVELYSTVYCVMYPYAVQYYTRTVLYCTGLLISIPVLRMNTGTMCIYVYICA